MSFKGLELILQLFAVVEYLSIGCGGIAWLLQPILNLLPYLMVQLLNSGDQLLILFLLLLQQA